MEKIFVWIWKEFLVIIRNVKKQITVPMKTHTDRILRYFSKLSGNTQSCKQEAYKEQNTTGRKKIRCNLKREKLQNQSSYLECEWAINLRYALQKGRQNARRQVSQNTQKPRSHTTVQKASQVTAGSTSCPWPRHWGILQEWKYSSTHS